MLRKGLFIVPNELLNALAVRMEWWKTVAVRPKTCPFDAESTNHLRFEMLCEIFCFYRWPSLVDSATSRYTPTLTASPCPCNALEALTDPDYAAIKAHVLQPRVNMTEQEILEYFHEIVCAVVGEHIRRENNEKEILTQLVKIKERPFNPWTGREV